MFELNYLQDKDKNEKQCKCNIPGYVEHNHPSYDPSQGFPSPSYSSPGSSHGHPSTDHTAGSGGWIPITTAKPSSGYTKPALTFSQPPIIHTKPLVTYTTPTPTYTKPEGSYSQQADSHTKPTTTYTKPETSYSQPISNPAHSEELVSYSTPKPTDTTQLVARPNKVPEQNDIPVHLPSYVLQTSVGDYYVPPTPTTNYAYSSSTSNLVDQHQHSSSQSSAQVPISFHQSLYDAHLVPAPEEIPSGYQTSSTPLQGYYQGILNLAHFTINF